MTNAQMKYANELQAKSAYEQFVSEPHPEGFKVTYPSWDELEDCHKELWHRVVTAALNEKVIEACV